NHARLHDGGFEQISFQVEEPGVLQDRLREGADHLAVSGEFAFAVLADRLAVDRERLRMRQLAGGDQFGDARRDAAGPVKILAEKAASRLHVSEEWNLVPDALPVVVVELDAEMARDGVEMDRRVGRAADRRADDDRVLEGGPRHDVRRL